MSFNAYDDLIDLKGKPYLQTIHRSAWFREKHPEGSLPTEVVSLDPVLVKASVYDSSGNLLATGHAGAVEKGSEIWKGKAVEKAETAALGRALGAAGFGTPIDAVSQPP